MPATLQKMSVEVYLVIFLDMRSFLLFRAMSPSLDYAITVGLAVLLALKYVWWDGDSETDKAEDMTAEEKSTTDSTHRSVDIAADNDDGKSEGHYSILFVHIFFLCNVCIYLYQK